MNPFYLLYPLQTRHFDLRLQPGSGEQAFRRLEESLLRSPLALGLSSNDSVRVDHARDLLQFDGRTLTAHPTNSGGGGPADRLVVVASQDTLHVCQRVKPAFAVFVTTYLTVAGAVAVVGLIARSPAALVGLFMFVVGRAIVGLERGASPAGLRHWLTSHGFPNERIESRRSEPV